MNTTPDPFALTPAGVHLLKRVAEHIQAHPEELDMSSWDCGTTACLAGQACRMIGRPLTGRVFNQRENARALMALMFITPPALAGDVPLFQNWWSDPCLSGLWSHQKECSITAIHRFIEAHTAQGQGT